jgi:hypothetical protein
MVKAIINISENANQVLNIVKAKNKLNDKSEAIEFVTLEYGEDLLEPELRPEFIEKVQRTEEEKGIKFKSVRELKERYK